MNLISANRKKIIRIIGDIIVIEFGLMISSFGTALFYAGDLGSGAMATFCDGLHRVMNISYGSANTGANAVLLAILFLLDRKYINIGTILCVVTIGPWVNLFTPILQNLGIAAMGMPVRLMSAALGTVLMGIGLGLYMAVNRGLGALEGFVRYLREKTGITVKTAKVIQDAVLVLGGILLGASWGAGTLLGIVCTGPVLQASCRFFERQLALLWSGIGAQHRISIRKAD